MASEKVSRILKARGAPFRDEEISAMGDSEGWAWIYANKAPKKRLPTRRSTEVCFTGFNPTDKGLLMDEAIAAGVVVRSGVTKGLTHLCAGPNAGPAKLAKAKKQGVKLIDVEGFRALVEQDAKP